MISDPISEAGFQSGEWIGHNLGQAMYDIATPKLTPHAAALVALIVAMIAYLVWYRRNQNRS